MAHETKGPLCVKCDDTGEFVTSISSVNGKNVKPNKNSAMIMLCSCPAGRKKAKEQEEAMAYIS